MKRDWEYKKTTTMLTTAKPRYYDDLNYTRHFFEAAPSRQRVFFTPPTAMQKRNETIFFFPAMR